MKNIELLTFSENEKMIKKITSKNLKSSNDFNINLQKEVEKMGYDFEEYQQYISLNFCANDSEF